jgi:LysM repeat protein
MDTISRENNSMLPVGGIIVGAIALIFGLYAAVSLSKVRTQLAQQQEKIDKIDDIAAQASAASSKADSTKSSLDSVAKQTQDAFTAVGNSIGTIQAQLTKMQETPKRAEGREGREGRHAAHEPAVAGPGEYVVKPGDSGAKIARANGVTLADLQSVNPGIDWRRLKVGQKIKLPEKKT